MQKNTQTDISAMNEIRKAYDQWKSGTISNDEYCLTLMDESRPVIKKVAMDISISDHMQAVEVMQNANMMLIDKYQTFDPYKTNLYIFIKTGVLAFMHRHPFANAK